MGQSEAVVYDQGTVCQPTDYVLPPQRLTGYSGMGVLAALILVSSIATSTLTQSAVTYPTRMVAVPGNGTATSTRSTEYFWVTANTNAISTYSSIPSYCDCPLITLRGSDDAIHSCCAAGLVYTT